MTYESYITRVKDLVIVGDQNTGYVYIDPDWVHTLKENDLFKLEEFDLTYPILLNILNLEVERIKSIYELHRNYIIDWIYNVITNIDNLETAEGNDYIKNLTEYLRQKDKIIDKELQLKQREEALDKKAKARSLVPGLMNFSKRDK